MSANLYTAKNLEEIAEQFERLARDQDNRASKSSTDKVRRDAVARSQTYMSAAHMLRNTTLTGEK